MLRHYMALKKGQVMSDSDLINLYSGQLLELAANIPLSGRLAAPMGTARKRSPLCGSSITVDVSIMKDPQDALIITDFRQEVRACALGQASASVLGEVVIGRSEAELVEARAKLSDMLSKDAPAPSAPFDRYALLSPARSYKNRHASILLALDCTIAAIEDAKAKA